MFSATLILAMITLYKYKYCLSGNMEEYIECNNIWLEFSDTWPLSKIHNIIYNF